MYQLAHQYFDIDASSLFDIMILLQEVPVTRFIDHMLKLFVMQTFYSMINEYLPASAVEPSSIYILTYSKTLYINFG